jgi:hypothetical protein
LYLAKAALKMASNLGEVDVVLAEDIVQWERRLMLWVCWG